MNLAAYLIPVLTLLPFLPAQDFKTLLATGKQNALAHEWKTAVDLLEQAVKLAPDDVEALRWRGHAYTGFKQYDKALVDLDRAVELYAKDSWTQYARAMALHHLGRYEDAVDGYTIAHNLDPKFSKPLEWRGFTLSLLGEHIRALADIQQAIAQNRGNSWLWFIRAKTYVALLDYVRAEEDLWRVVDAEESNADAHAQLGYLCACTGDRVTAKTMLSRAVKLAPAGQIEGRAWLFHLHLARKEPKLAQAQLATVFAEQKKEGADTQALLWPGQIARYLDGKLSAAKLLHLARTIKGLDVELEDQEEQNKRIVRGRLCEAWLHIGLSRQEAGMRSEALLALARAVATDARDKWEWSWSRRLLTEICYPEN